MDVNLTSIKSFLDNEKIKAMIVESADKNALASNLLEIANGQNIEGLPHSFFDKIKAGYLLAFLSAFNEWRDSDAE